MKAIYQERYQRLIDVLIETRKAQNLTQEDMAEKLQRSQSSIAKIEKPEKRLTLIEFVDFCEVLGLSPAEVLKDIFG